MPSADEIRAQIDAYRAAADAADRDAWVGCFADDGVMEDPVGSARNVGRDALGTFFDTMFAAVEGVGFAPDDIIVLGDEAVMVSTFTCRLKSGQNGVMRGVHHFRVGPDGRFAEVRVFWDGTSMQLVER